MEIKAITIGDEGQAATAALLARLPALRARLAAIGGMPLDLVERTQRGLETLRALERQHGGLAPITLEGTAELVAALLTDLARLDAAARPAKGSPDRAALALEVADFVLGVATWALRHAVPIDAVEPVVNALALRADATRARPELAAACALMLGVIAHVTPRLGPDLERSNPERPWRILHVNLAITAIRSEDPALIDHAFDALDAALPDERAGFYAEALALALAPGIAPVVRERIEARHLKWTAARGMGENSGLI